MTAPNVDYLQSSPNSISLSNTTTITRSVPRRCEVCKAKKKRMPTCEVCEGKGWLYIWETETTYYPQPYTPQPTVTPQPYTQPQWTPTGPIYDGQTAKPMPHYPGIAINCMVGHNAR